MIPVKSATEIARELASRLRARRLQRGWTQSGVAERAGIRPATYVLFERTGQISLVRLLKLLEVLGLAEQLDQIGRHEDFSTMTLADVIRPVRQRGSRKST